LICQAWEICSIFFSAEGFNLKLTNRDSLKNRVSVIAPEPIAPGTPFALIKDVLGGGYGKRNSTVLSGDHDLARTDCPFRSDYDGPRRRKGIAN
jgi:hypothetical protein